MKHFGGALFVSCVVLLLAACGAKTEKENPTTTYYYAATMMVEKTLKAPSTAKFSNYYSADCECGSKALINGSYETWGWVDSQNGFGAMIRSKWRMVIVHQGTNYIPSYFEFDGKTVIGDYQKAIR